MQTQKRISVNQLLKSIGEVSEVLGRRDRYVSVASPIDRATSESVTFCIKKAAEGLQVVRNSKAGVVVCHTDLQFYKDDLKDKTVILVLDPRSAFVRLMRSYFEERIDFDISSTAVVEKEAEISPSVHIGPYSYIGRCRIGEGTIIYGHVYIYPNVTIGKNVMIHAGTVVGAHGMQFQRVGKGELEKFSPQLVAS